MGSDPARNLDVNFKDLLNDVLFKRDWFREFLDERDDRQLKFVGSFDVSADTKVIAKDIRTTLLGSGEGMPPAANWEEYLRLFLMTKAEDVGIWVCETESWAATRIDLYRLSSFGVSPSAIR